MNYVSTRGMTVAAHGLHSADAIKKGLADDGGLFMPAELPLVSADEICQMSKMTYPERAAHILGKFLTDYPAEQLLADCRAAYDESSFVGGAAPLHKLNDTVHVMELWHGPTCAFKDMALQLLPHLLTKAFKKQADGKKAVILVATSGDTGKAALEGFKDVENTQIIVFYPENGVSPMQLRQMNTQEGENVCVCAVKGNFDDCQTQVKRIFTSVELKKLLAENNMLFSSADKCRWLHKPQHYIHFVQCPFSHIYHIFAKLILCLVNARCIEENNLSSLIGIHRLNSGTGGLRLIGRNRNLLLYQMVHKRRLSYVRSAD